MLWYFNYRTGIFLAEIFFSLCTQTLIFLKCMQDYTAYRVFIFIFPQKTFMHEVFFIQQFSTWKRSAKSVGIIQKRKSELQGKAIRRAVRHKCEYIKTYVACFQGIKKVMNDKHLSGPLKYYNKLAVCVRGCCAWVSIRQ